MNTKTESQILFYNPFTSLVEHNKQDVREFAFTSYLNFFLFSQLY